MLYPISIHGELEELFVADNPKLQEALEKVTPASEAHLAAGRHFIDSLVEDEDRSNFECSMTPIYQILALFGVIEQLGSNFQGNILYVASSYGMGMKMIQTAGFTNIRGVDIDEKAVEFCKQQGLNVSLMDASNMKFQDESFDIIVSRDFVVRSYLLHDHEVVSFLDEQHRLLKKGGSAIFTTLGSCLSDGAVLDMDYPHEAVINQSGFSDCKKVQKFVDVRSKHSPELGKSVYCIEIYEK